MSLATDFPAQVQPQPAFLIEVQAAAIDTLRDAVVSRVHNEEITDLDAALAFINAWADSAVELAATLKPGGERNA